VRLSVALIVERDGDAAVQERELAEALGERVEAEFGRLEDLFIGLERDLGAALLGRPRHLEIALRRAALVALGVDLAVAPDLEIELLRQCVHDRNADAVQAARHLVAVVVELAAGVQDREHDLRGGAAAGVLIGRDPAAVVDDGDRVVDVQRDVDLIAMTGQRLVDRVVDDLVDEMVQPGSASRADVHRRTLADRFEAFEDLDLVRTVIVRRARTVAVCTGTRVIRRGHAIGHGIVILRRRRRRIRRFVMRFGLRHSVMGSIGYRLSRDRATRGTGMNRGPV
jgi:hypothetical protein